MLKKIIVILLIAISSVFIFFVTQIALYLYNQNENKKETDFCKFISEGVSESYNPDSCYCKMYSLLLPRLLVYKVKSDNKDLKFVRYGENTFIVPTIVLDKADAFISYGIQDIIDIEKSNDFAVKGILDSVSFENNISDLYKKKIYIYDCGVNDIKRKNSYMFFSNECLNSDKNIYKIYDEFTRGLSKNVHNFGEKLKELNLEDKKIFLKMSISGSETDVLPDILKYTNNLTGFAIEIRLQNSETIVKINELLKLIEKDFVLVARNQSVNGCMIGFNCRYIKEKEVSPIISLTFVNKDLVDKQYLPVKQDYHDIKNYEQKYKLNKIVPPYNINLVVTMCQKIKNILNMEI